MMFGWRAAPEEVDRILALAIDEGINFIDTSVSYGRGASETILGDAFSRLGIRDRLLLATKFGLASEPNPGPNDVGNTKANLLRQCELSLRRLRAGHIDLLQIHWPSQTVPIEETLRGLELLIKQGKVRYIGLSNFAAWQAVECLWCSERRYLTPISSMQLRYNLLDRRAELDLLPMSKRFGVAVITYSPLAEGLLGGQYSRAGGLPTQSRFAAASNSAELKARLTAPVWEVIECLRNQASEARVSMAELAFAWILRTGAISCVLAGPSKSEQLKSILPAVTGQIDGQLLCRIDERVPFGNSLI